MKSKKAISGIVSSLLLIAITVSLIVVVWGVINNLVLDKIDEGTSCGNIFGKIELNGRYTCYNSSSNELLFAINRKDIEIDALVIIIETRGNFKTLNLKDTSQIDNLRMYNGDQNIVIPEKNGGVSYNYNLTGAGFTQKPDAISIAPVIKGRTCPEIDSVQRIENCGLFIN